MSRWFLRLICRRMAGVCDNCARMPIFRGETWLSGLGYLRRSFPTVSLEEEPCHCRAACSLFFTANTHL